MAAQQLATQVKPQLIPTNVGLRTYASPPQALQEHIVPNDLFYVRNHWKDSPQIDVDSYRLVVDGPSEASLESHLPRTEGPASEEVPGDL